MLGGLPATIPRDHGPAAIVALLPATCDSAITSATARTRAPASGVPVIAVFTSSLSALVTPGNVLPGTARVVFAHPFGNQAKCLFRVRRRRQQQRQAAELHAEGDRFVLLDAYR